MLVLLHIAYMYHCLVLYISVTVNGNMNFCIYIYMVHFHSHPLFWTFSLDCFNKSSHHVGLNYMGYP